MIYGLVIIVSGYMGTGTDVFLQDTYAFSSMDDCEKAKPQLVDFYTKIRPNWKVQGHCNLMNDKRDERERKER